MTRNHLTHFIISILLLCSVSASACIWSAPERWYMFQIDTPTFDKYFQNENQKFWTQYSGEKQPLEWFSAQDMRKAAAEKQDKAMMEYLDALDKYMDVSSAMSADQWDYPTAQELAQRRQTIMKLHDECLKHTSGQLADRWLLLEMRTNMLLKNYTDNISLWENKGEKMPDGYVKEMMRNIYANALLNTGKKMEAWNIYAHQNDEQSLVWSTRKFTNLAGIKSIQRQTPDAPVFKYLLSRYVNSVQDVLDMYYDDLAAKSGDNIPEDRMNWDFKSYWEDVLGEAYAPISDDYMKEIKEFVAFSDSVAHLPSTVDPALWESASAICAYYLGDYSLAKTRIAQALDMKGDRPTKDMARRIRMLITTSSDDIESPEFKEKFAAELSWLDGQTPTDGSSNAASRARDRILNLGLTRNYEARGDSAMAHLIAICRDYINANEKYVTSPMIADIYPMSSEEMTHLYATLDNPGSDPLVRYAASKIRLSDDFRNDLLGTKYLQEGKWAQALPYLKKVSMDYLNNQPIAFYAARRDYNIPAWNGFQTVGDNNYEETSKPQHLTRNAKADFCEEMLRLEDEAKNATAQRRQEIALAQAAALYQASRFGQCWYLSQYGFSRYDDRPVKSDELAGKAIAKLLDCTKSADPKVRATALFGLAYAAPDRWMTEDSEWVDDRFKNTVTVNRDSKQYSYLSELCNLLKSQPQASLPEISRCDVLKGFQKHAK